MPLLYVKKGHCLKRYLLMLLCLPLKATLLTSVFSFCLLIVVVHKWTLKIPILFKKGGRARRCRGRKFAKHEQSLAPFCPSVARAHGRCDRNGSVHRHVPNRLTDGPVAYFFATCFFTISRYSLTSSGDPTAKGTRWWMVSGWTSRMR